MGMIVVNNGKVSVLNRKEENDYIKFVNALQKKYPNGLPDTSGYSTRDLMFMGYKLAKEKNSK